MEPLHPARPDLTLQDTPGRDGGDLFGFPSAGPQDGQDGRGSRGGQDGRGGRGRTGRRRLAALVAVAVGAVLLLALATVKLWPHERPPVRVFTPDAVSSRTLSTPGPCLPKPSRCGFPDATTTGYQHTGVHLTPYDGPYTIDQSGTTIDGKLIRGSLVVKADNVTIRRSLILIDPADADHDLAAIRVREGMRNALIEDTRVDAGGMGIGIELAGVNGVALRTDVLHAVDYFRGNAGTVVEASYGHDASAIPGGHSDGFQSLGASNLTLTGNTLVLPYGPNVNSVVTIGSDFAAPSAVRIEGNLLAGGGWTISLARGGTGIVVKGNRIARTFGYGALRDEASTMWSANVWDDTRAPVTR